jgi:chromosome partitioning protein
MAKTIAVVNQKGGVAKTTTAIHISASLALHHGKRVLLIDADQQGNASDTLFSSGEIIKFPWVLYNILTDTDVNFSRVWARAEDKAGNPGALFKSRIDNLYIVPSELSLGKIERDFAAKVGGVNVLKRKLDQPFKDSWDYIIIDCPPNMGLMTANALVASDYVLIPVTPDWYAQYGIKLLLDFVNEVKIEVNENLSILGVVITNADARTKILQITIEDLRKVFDDKLFDTIIGRNTDINQGIMMQKTIYEYHPAARGAEDYQKLTNEFLRRIEHVQKG